MVSGADHNKLAAVRRFVWSAAAAADAVALFAGPARLCSEASAALEREMEIWRINSNWNSNSKAVRFGSSGSKRRWSDVAAAINRRIEVGAFERVRVARMRARSGNLSGAARITK